MGLISLNEVWDFNNRDLAAIETSPTYKITEDYLVEGATAPEVDGKIILGKIVGPSFFGDGVSRNQRFYPRALWERQLSLPRIKERLANKIMLGCIGHDDGCVTEQDISSGKVSHIVTNLYLKENNQGIAELLILNTPAGRNLYTLMKAGSRIKISTRAQGKFLEGQTHNGLPIVDPESFILETLDLVLEPGFIETDPRLQESLDKVTQKVTSIIESRKTYTSNISSTKQIKENKGENIMEITESFFNEIRSASNAYKSLYEEEKERREEAEKETAEAEKEAEECKKELEECKKQLFAYQNLGEAAEIRRTLQEYAELGFSSPTEAAFILNSLKEEAEDAIDKEEVEDIKKDVQEAAKLLAQYESLGTVAELAAIKEAAEELVDELDKKEEEEVTERLCKKYKGIPENLIRRVVEATEDEEEAEKEIEEALEGMADATTDDKSGTDLEDFENGHELPNKVNDNDVEADPNVVEESLKRLASKSSKSSMMEGYVPGKLVQSMFD